jgi:DNA-binding FadR family transcriptional regulator
MTRPEEPTPADTDDRRLVTLLRTARPSAGPATRSASIALDIEELILRGDLQNGQRLPTENELGEMLGVSRSVVRDAVRMLAARGLLDVRQGHGTIVAAPSDDAFSNALVGLLMRSGHTMGDVLEARSALELHLTPLIVQNATEEDLERLDDRFDAMAVAVAAGDEEAIDAAHLDFHRAMYNALHRGALEAVLRPMQRCILLTSPLLPPEDRTDWLESHREILVALRARDSAQAQAAVRDHFADLRDARYDAWRERPFREVAVLDAERLRAAALRESAG